MFINTIIIGGGISGILSLKHLKEEGINAIILEKNSEPFGVWNIKNNPSVFNDTYTVSSKLYMTISDFPIPKEYPEFPHWKQIMDYYKSYVYHFKLNNHIKTNQLVLRVKKVKDIWSLEVRDNLFNKNYILECKYLIIASGSNNDCLNYPTDEKYLNFKGETYHCNNIKNIMDKFIDKKILVVGGSDSASDIATNLSKDQIIHLSMRSGQWFQPRSLGVNEPADMLYNRALDNLIKKILGKKYIHKVFGQDRIKNYYGEGGSGIKEWKPKCMYLNSYYNKSRDILERINRGRVVPHGDVENIRGYNIKFVNDEKWYKFDTILFCTGYKALDCFKFLEEKIVKTPKYKFIVYPDDNSIMFTGFIRPYLTSIPMLVEFQSRMIARICADKLKLPPKNKMEKIVKKDIEKQKKEFPCDSKRMSFLVDPYDYCKEITKIIGENPNVSKLFFTNHKLWKKITYGSWNHHVYRLNDVDPSKRKIALENIDEAYNNGTSKKIESEIQKRIIKVAIIIIILLLMIILLPIFSVKLIRKK